MPWLLLLLPAIAVLWWLRRSKTTDVMPRRPEAARPQPAPRPATASDLGYPGAETDEPSDPLGYVPGSAPATHAEGLVEDSEAAPRHAAETSSGDWSSTGAVIADSAEGAGPGRVPGAARAGDAVGWSSMSAGGGSERAAAEATDPVTGVATGTGGTSASTQDPEPSADDALSAEGAESVERTASQTGEVEATPEPATARWVGTAGAATAAGPDAAERAGRLRLDDMAPGTDAYTMTTTVDEVAAPEEATEVQHALADAATDIRREFIAEGPHGPSSAVPGPDGSGPEGWTVKADGTSMRFVLPGDAGYESVTATAWFADEDDARRAGFDRSAG